MDIGSTSSYVLNANQLWALGNANELWTIVIAAYAAIVSTFVLGWDAYKWLASGAKIYLTVSHNMHISGGLVPDPKTYIVITVCNVGDQPTTITNLGGMYFESWWGAYISRRKPNPAFIVNTPSLYQKIPYRFEVGDQWLGQMEQTEETTNQAKNGYLFLILYTAGGGRGHRVRVKIKEKKVAKL